ncbi:Small glutamine-rich tetratricopeptide repeat-containing protein 2 [Intoshia linei]|uniref:Small glutamine-rich tetratricopeptide repeat-containing protein 2 n=1 Tax=Intoshia linei TaxID=1819745 RepID=A0A177BBB1_9BILA|nr:Small glutamine-rich tetratricopeptide repeat-containing protein 2 [Intoshia linei]
MDKKMLISAIAAFFRREKENFGKENKISQVNGVDSILNLMKSVYANQIDETMDSSILDKLIISSENIPHMTVLNTEADDWKVKGNNLMIEQKLDEALVCYDKAIEINPRNPVFYGNKAAVLNKKKDFLGSIYYCDLAIEIDPQYSKAFSRKGLALVGLNKHEDAVKCYEKAIELDPKNESYKKNLQIAKSKLPQIETQTANPAAAQSPIPGLNFAELMNNPNIMNLASQVMQDPNLQQTMASIMQNSEANSPNNAMNAFTNFISQNPNLVNNLMGSLNINQNQNENPNDETDKEKEKENQSDEDMS